MRRLALAVLVLTALAAPALAQEKPVTVAYYYRVRWGFQQEFERLFFRNHYPVLKEQMGEGGRIRAVSVYRPTFHGEGRAEGRAAPVRGPRRPLGRASLPRRAAPLTRPHADATG